MRFPKMSSNKLKLRLLDIENPNKNGEKVDQKREYAMEKGVNHRWILQAPQNYLWSCQEKFSA